MRSNDNICGERLAYENSAHESLTDDEADLHEAAHREVENALAIIAEIQNERKNDEGEITEPLTTTQVNTILEIGTPMERALAVLEALDDSTVLP